jgi:hypothetical protein
MSTPTTANRPPVLRTPWLRRILLAGVAFLIFVWALPIALAHSPFVAWVEREVSARTGCTVRIGGLSLRWFASVTAQDVELRDSADQPVFTAATVESQRTLFGLLLHRDNPGAFRVERASIDIVFAGTRSNLDEALTQLIEPAAGNRVAENPVAQLPPLEVEVIDSRVQVTDQTTGAAWQMPLHATVLLFHDRVLPVQARVHGVLGSGSVEASVVVHAKDGVWKRGEVKSRLQGVPLELTVPLLRRWVPDTDVAGQVQGQCLFSWEMGGGNVTNLALEGEVTGMACAARFPGLQERLVFDQLRLPWKLHYDGANLAVASAELSCDLGHARYSGSIDLAAPGLAWLDRPGHEVSASFDLVRLAERLPKTLRLHPDLRLTSGRLRLDGKSGGTAAAAEWEARVQVTNITGVRGNQPILWQEPVVFEGRARQVGRGVPLVQDIHCTSGFLQLDGATTEDGFHFVADADLGKLADPLHRFIDLGSTRLSGQAHAEFIVQPRAGQRFIASGTGQVSDLFVEWVNGRPAQEEMVALELTAAGIVGLDGEQRVENARLTAVLAGDRLQADLAEPLPDLGGPDWGVWQVRLEGDLARWQKRAHTGTSALDHCHLGGTVIAEGQVRRGARGLECPALAVVARDFTSTAAGFAMAEPTLYLHTAACLDGAGTLQLRDVQLRCASLSATAQRLSWAPGTAALQGAVRLRGDLARLQQWWKAPRAAVAGVLAGELDGQLELRPAGDTLDLTFQFGVNDSADVDGNAAGEEPQIRLTGKARLEPGHDRLVLAPLQMDGPLGAVEIRGTVANLADSWDLDLSGELHYDLARLEPLLAPALGGDLRLAGKDSRSFYLTGPLCPAAPGIGPHFTLARLPMPETPARLHDLTGDGALSWQALHALGCDVGPAELRFCLQQGWLQLLPLDTTLNGGRLRLQPNLRLEPGPAELVFTAGPVIEKARLTPALCAGALGYALPALGNVSDVQGNVSLTLDGGRIPLGDPSRADVKGKLALENVRFGPGALSHELSDLFKTPAPSGLIRRCEVMFHLVNGRIHHRDLDLTFPEFTVRTSGSVGLDGSLILLAEMPIPPKLLGSANVTSALAAHKIRVPISGTVDQPRIDQKALNAVAAQLLRDSSGDALKHELEHKLKGLLKPGHH